MKIDLFNASSPLHSHDEIWLRVHAPKAVDLPTALNQLSDYQRALLAGQVNQFTKPCAYFPDSPASAEERKFGLFIDWWTFPGVLNLGRGEV